MERSDMDWRQYTSTLGLALRAQRELTTLLEAAHAGDADELVRGAQELQEMLSAMLSDFGLGGAGEVHEAVLVELRKAQALVDRFRVAVDAALAAHENDEDRLHSLEGWRATVDAIAQQTQSFEETIQRLSCLAGIQCVALEQIALACGLPVNPEADPLERARAIADAACELLRRSARPEVATSGHVERRPGERDTLIDVPGHALVIVRWPGSEARAVLTVQAVFAALTEPQERAS
jgi:hypothetical protein